MKTKLIHLSKESESMCFGCSAHNPHGIHLEFHTDGKVIFTKVILSEQFCGWNGVAHGGIVSTILDELMGWSVYRAVSRKCVTKSMHVEFLKPVRTQKEINGEGRFVTVRNDREAVAEAVLFQDGRPCAKASSVFALL